MTEDPRELNRAAWDERVGIHVGSEFYNRAGVIAGTHDPLRDFEVAELGDVTGLDLVHLQCHFGLDTLGWARRGARVTGLDFSGEAVAAAQAVAAAAGLDAEFVESDVFDAIDALGGRTFDVVYTGLGALCWLDDLLRWAEVVRTLLRPGGVLYLAEFHPIGDVFGDDDRTIEHDYFETTGIRWDEESTYTDNPDGITMEHTVMVEWRHPIGEVLTVILDAGLVLESFHEHDHTLFPRWPDLVVDGDRYRIPAGQPRLPLMYSLRARRPR